MINSLWHSNPMWHENSMSWCLTAPSPYLNQCWLIISEIFWPSLEGNFTMMSILDMSMKIVFLNLQWHITGANHLSFKHATNYPMQALSVSWACLPKDFVSVVILIAYTHSMCRKNLCTYLCFSLWPSDTILQHRSGSTLSQVRAWCLMAPSHYINQCWLIITEVQW